MQAEAELSGGLGMHGPRLRLLVFDGLGEADA